MESGLAQVASYEARARVGAATDLMEQVQVLLDDRAVHPAAPVMLAGAALEEFLRSLIASGDVQLSQRPSIAMYANALRGADLLTAQEVKDITAWAGQRNQAAHGKFDELSRERAQIMVDGINLFMQRRSPTPVALESAASVS